MEKVIKRFAAFVLAFITAVAMIVPALFRVSADVLEFDDTSVLDDLSDMDLSQFAGAEDEEMRLLRFTEYCYQSESDNAFGLYVYIFNPARIEISTREGANTINMAIGYGADGKPNEYANLKLLLCDYSGGVYSRLFYKFRVSEKVDRLYANARTSETKTGERRYDVAGLQFWEKGASSAASGVNMSSADLGAVKDYSVSRTFFFSGYAKGYGNGAEKKSTLECRYDELTTITLELQHTNYRMSKPYKDYTYEEVNSVYFAVPNSVFEQYGSLQTIKAEWYEYKTNPIFVTKDENAYNELLDWIAVDVGEYTEANPWRVFWEEYAHSDEFTTTYEYSALYNQKRGTVNGYVTPVYSFLSTAQSVTSMDWLFYRKNPSALKDYEVSRAEVEKWAESYSDAHLDQDKLEARKTFWAEGLFSESIDEDRIQYLDDQTKTRGYVVQTISADEKQDLLQYKKPTFWELLTGKKKTESTSYDPIVTVTSDMLKGTDESVCDNLLINVNDYKDTDGKNNDVSFYDFCQTAFEANETPVLFRFANTDYYAAAAYFDKRGNNKMTEQDGYVCRQTCFLDFDVISLTFEKNGQETVLGCVSDPIDIFNGTTPPTDLIIKSSCETFDLKKLLSILIIVLAATLVVKVVKGIRNMIDRKTLRDVRKSVRKNKRGKR